ncbi:MAG: hypothetical protein CR968_03985 [Flavobacteriia bacterium]|nr:MAG: hypothetical protein CR968_03985 [Flavobacteriia bacterium]
MKKMYLVLALLISVMSFGQTPIITAIADGDCTLGNPKMVEIYAMGTVDFSQYSIEKQSNGNSWGTTTNLADLGTVTDGFVYVYSDSQDPEFFPTEFPSATTVMESNVVKINGDDGIRIIKDADSSVVDQYGADGVDGSGTVWEYKDGYAKRNNNTGPDNGFVPGNWTFANLALDGQGTCQGGDTFETVMGGIGTFTHSGASCGVTLGSPVIDCQSSTMGDNNDDVVINISYTGSDSSITGLSVEGATVGGDNPASVADGTISITGLKEGDSWELVINGGNCDGSSVSGMIAADHCDPAPNVCFDLSTGDELFELVTVQTNSDGDEWTIENGTYSINGYCGGGCEETVEGWLIFGPLDMTDVSDLKLAFDAAESFGVTDLVVAHTDAYPGCPSDATWTTLETITDPGSYDIDLSAVTGTEIFIGIQYMDDGVGDGYSGWSLSNVALESFNTCPVLGVRPVSDCNTCDLSLGDSTAACDTDADTYTASIPFEGGGDETYTITADSGTVGGDDPSSVASGTITVTGVAQGTDLVVNITGGNCEITENITSPICVTCPGEGSIILTEIMQNPAAVGDNDGEWFEVYNTTSASIDLYGWVIMDDESADEKFTVESSVVVPAGGYAVFGSNGDTSANGGVTVDYVYSGITLGNGSDGIKLTCSDTVIDIVVWDNGATFPDPSGASMELANDKLTATDNDNGANWGTATDVYGAGDMGTPGAVNTFTLVTSGIENIEIEGFNIYPNPVDHILYINTKANAEKHVSIFDVLGKQVVSQNVIGQSMMINLPAGTYIIMVEENGKTATQKLMIK